MREARSEAEFNTQAVVGVGKVYGGYCYFKVAACAICARSLARVVGVLVF